MQGDHLGTRLWLSRLGFELHFLRFERQQFVTNSCSGGEATSELSAAKSTRDRALLEKADTN